jgi:hypothetical protein
MSVLALDSAHLPSIMAVGAMYRGRAMLEDAHAAFARAYELAPGTLWESLDHRDLQCLSHHVRAYVKALVTPV